LVGLIMSLINHASKMIGPSDLNIFGQSPTDASIQEMSELALHPITAAGIGTSFEFKMTGSTDEYVKLPFTYLTFAVQILDARTKQPISAANHVGVVNNFAHSLIRRLTIMWNNQIVEIVEDYCYGAYKHVVFTYGEDCLKSLGGCWGYYGFRKA
jgi:hypothetical protein